MEYTSARARRAKNKKVNMILTTQQIDKVDELPFMLMAQCLSCKKWLEFEDCDENVETFIKITCECGGRLKQSTLISKRTFKGK